MTQGSMKILVPGVGGICLPATAWISRFIEVFAVISTPYDAGICDLIQYRQEQENKGGIA
jgi:hypothetical protein